MRQGMDRGKPSQDRKPTSRIARPGDPSTKRVQAVSKPATGRMNAQGSGTSRAEAQQQRQAQPAQAPDSSKNTLYIGIGGGALVLVLIIAFMIGSGDEGGRSGGGNSDVALNRAISKATEAYQQGNYRLGLDLCDEAMKDPRVHRSSRYSALQSLGNMCRSAVNLDRDAQIKVTDFKKKIEAAKAAGTAMANANQLWDECLSLLGQFGASPAAAKDLRGIKEDLGRWVNTERQGDWQKDYNITKGRIEKSHLASQNYSEAIREWHRFGEVSQDPLLHSRIEQEVRTINQTAVSSAEKLVAEAGTGADARAKLEEGQQKFSGTEGQAVINKAMRGLK